MLRSCGRFGLAWRAGALKCYPRDRFIGWKPSQQVERLHLVASNTRQLLLPEPGAFAIPGNWFVGGIPRRLSDNWKATYGHPLELAETFESLKATDRERDAQRRFTDLPEKPLHGRRDTRSIECISPLDNLSTIPHARQMFRISRERKHSRSGRTSIERDRLALPRRGIAGASPLPQQRTLDPLNRTSLPDSSQWGHSIKQLCATVPGLVLGTFSRGRH